MPIVASIVDGLLSRLSSSRLEFLITSPNVVFCRFLNVLVEKLEEVSGDEQATKLCLGMIASGIEVQNRVAKLVDAYEMGNGEVEADVDLSSVERAVLNLPVSGVINEDHVGFQAYRENAAGFAQSLKLADILKKK
jgi:hypothetical protein